MTTQRKARGAYSVGQATRESILSAAMVLIAERGYNGFSLRDPGRRGGVSPPPAPTSVVESVFPTPPSSITSLPRKRSCAARSSVTRR